MARGFASSALGRADIADVADPLKQLIEVVAMARPRRILQPLVVHREALDQELREAGDGPYALHEQRSSCAPGVGLTMRG